MKITIKAWLLILTCMLSIHQTVAAEEISGFDILPKPFTEADTYFGRDLESPLGNESIDPFTGSLRLNYVDLSLPGQGGMDITLHRNYISHQSAKLIHQLGIDPFRPLSSMGLNWTMHYGRILVNAKANVCQYPFAAYLGEEEYSVVFELPDGRSTTLYTDLNTGNHKLESRDGYSGECTSNNSDRKLVITSPDGLRYTFLFNLAFSDSNSEVREKKRVIYTSYLTDNNNNELQFSYQKSVNGDDLVPVVLTTIKANDGRRVNLNYDVDYDAGIPVLLRLKSITTPDRPGYKMQYQYGDVSKSTGYDIPSTYESAFTIRSQLKRVILPDGSFWQYDYKKDRNPGFMSVRRVTYPRGAKVDYTYAHAPILQDNTPKKDFTVVANRSIQSAAGVASATWRFDYKPRSDNGFDVTTVDTPKAGVKLIYKHYGYGRASATSNVNGGAEQKPWKVGLLKSKTLKDGTTILEQTTNTWGHVRKVSTQTSNRYIEGSATSTLRSIYSHSLTRKIIQRNGLNYRTDYSNFDNHGQARTITEYAAGYKTQNLANGYSSSTRIKTITYEQKSGQWAHTYVKKTVTKDADGSNDSVVEHTYDTKFNRIKTNDNGLITSYRYTSNGDLKDQQDGNGNITYYKFYYRGQPQTIEKPEQGIRILQDVNDDGSIASFETKGAIGDGINKYRFRYDEMGRLVSTDFPKGATEIISYSNLQRVSNRGNLKTVNNLDGFGRVIEKRLINRTNNDYISMRYEFDGVGDLIKQSRPFNSAGLSNSDYTVFTYDALSRVTSQQQPGRARVTYNYSSDRITITNERNYQTVNYYAAWGNPSAAVMVESRQTAGNGQTNPVIEFVYNKRGDIKEISSQTITRAFTYNNNFLLAKRIEPEVGTTAYTYDNAGNMKTKKVNSALIATYYYDDINRLISVDYADANTADETIQYDRNDNKVYYQRGNVATYYKYDVNDNLINEEIQIGGIFDTPITVLTYEYNNLDQLSVLRYITGAVITFAPDPFGRPTQAGGLVSQIQYHANGQMKKMVYGNGLSTNIRQNNRFWPESIISSNNTLNLSYQYDDRGNPTRIVLDDESRSLNYDGLDRLIRASYTDQSGGRNNTVIAFKYDPHGNMISNNNQTYYYDNKNRLNRIGSQPAFEYDGLGNIIGNGLQMFTYDKTPNLVELGNGVTYQYDGNNRMTVKTTLNGDKNISIYAANGDLMIEYDLTADSYREYVHVNGQRVGQREVKQANNPTPVTLDVSLNPDIILPGGTTMLSWTSTNALSCHLADTGDVLGTSGNIPLTFNASKTFNFYCQDADGARSEKTLTITVMPPPTLEISLNPDAVLPGETTRLIWNASNALSCHREDTGEVFATSGDILLTINAGESFNFYCLGAEGARIEKKLTLRHDLSWLIPIYHIILH